MKEFLSRYFVRRGFALMGFLCFVLTLGPLQGMGLTGIPLFIVAAAFLIMGIIGVIAQAIWADNRTTIQQLGNQVPAILTDFTHTGFHNEVNSSRELKLNFSYRDMQGQDKTGEAYVVTDPSIEARLERGMVLPIMYHDNIPNRLELPGPLNYDLLQWSKIYLHNFYNNQQ